MIINVHTDLHCKHIQLLMHTHVLYMDVMPRVWHCLYKMNGTDVLCGNVFYGHL